MRCLEPRGGSLERSGGSLEGYPTLERGGSSLEGGWYVRLLGRGFVCALTDADFGSVFIVLLFFWKG
jgi:hypothetical protein